MAAPECTTATMQTVRLSVRWMLLWLLEGENMKSGVSCTQARMRRHTVIGSTAVSSSRILPAANGATSVLATDWIPSQAGLAR